MTEDKIEHLYKTFARLADATSNKCASDYLTIISAVRGSTKEKMLACQFIPRFFGDFPELCDQALEAHLDLCEDEDVTVRKLAIKELPALCRRSPKYTQKIANILSQLLVVKDPSENAVVTETLQTIIKLDLLGSVKGLFNQIRQGEDEVREKCLKYFGIKVIGSDLITSEVEDGIIAEIKSIFEDAAHDEIPLAMSFLWRIGLGKTPESRLKFISIIVDVLQNIYRGDYSDEEVVDYYFVVVKQTLGLVKVDNTTPFMQVFVEVILPRLKKLPGYSDGSTTVLELFKLIAELVSAGTRMEYREVFLNELYMSLMEFLPELNPDMEFNSDDEPKLQFSYVECLLFIVHRMAQGCPGFFTDNPERLLEIKRRLHCFARALQGFIRSLKETVQDTRYCTSDSDYQLKIVALKTTTNINHLTKDFFSSKPEFSTRVTLSWDPLKANPKRSSLSVTEQVHSSKRSKHSHQQQIYQPPSGKYSSSIKRFPDSGNASSSPEPQFLVKPRRSIVGRWNSGGGYRRGNFRRWI